MYGEKRKLTKGAISFDPNALYLYYSGDVMSCGKDMLFVNSKLFDQKRIANFSKDVLKGKVLRRLILKYPTSFVTNLVR